MTIGSSQPTPKPEIWSDTLHVNLSCESQMTFLIFFQTMHDLLFVCSELWLTECTKLRICACRYILCQMMQFIIKCVNLVCDFCWTRWIQWIMTKSKSVLSVTITRNPTVSRQVVSVVTIPLLDFVMIHWIR